MAVLLLVHAPPAPDVVNASVAPVATEEPPDIVPADGEALTLTVAVV
jgi:hypothetical protein